jgi:hypothetical protein
MHGVATAGVNASGTRNLNSGALEERMSLCVTVPKFYIRRHLGVCFSMFSRCMKYVGERIACSSVWPWRMRGQVRLADVAQR